MEGRYPSVAADLAAGQPAEVHGLAQVPVEGSSGHPNNLRQMVALHR
jgi:hypothetical protein